MKTTLLALALTFLPAAAQAHDAQAAPAPAAASPGATAMRGFPQMAHVGIIVDDAKAAAARVIAMLGLGKEALVTDVVSVVHGGIYKGRKVDFTAQFDIVETGNAQIEYIQPLTGASSPYADALKGGLHSRVHHVAFVVPSIDARLAQARRENPAIEVVLDAPIGNVGRYVYVDGVIPGLLAEFIQFGPAR